MEVQRLGGGPSEQKSEFSSCTGLSCQHLLRGRGRDLSFSAQASLCFVFFLLQGDPGIQGYPGRKVRGALPVLLSEFSLTDALWAPLELSAQLCSCWTRGYDRPTDPILSP